jgi:hypothetical protein
MTNYNGKMCKLPVEKLFQKKNWMSDCLENFRNYCQDIFLMKYIIKNIGDQLNFCAIRLFG